MAHMNQKGPENEGPKTGRLLGTCRKTREEEWQSAKFIPGEGMGKQRKKGCGKGMGLRLRSSKIFD